MCVCAFVFACERLCLNASPGADPEPPSFGQVPRPAGHHPGLLFTQQLARGQAAAPFFSTSEAP